MRDRLDQQTNVPWRRVLVPAALVFIVVGFFGFDRVFYEQVSLRLNTENRPFDRDFYAITKPFWITCRYVFGHLFGGMGIYFLVLGLHPKGWRAANAVIVCAGLTVLLATLAQASIGRLRPDQADHGLAFAAPLGALLSGQTGSFPSSEATAGFALACVLGHLFPRKKAAFYSLATLVAISRLVNGAHYLSDVTAGALLGAVCSDALYPYVMGGKNRFFGTRRKHVDRCSGPAFGAVGRAG